MNIRKSKNFAKVVQHSGAAERVAEDTRKNSNYYNPKKKKYEYSDPDEEIADVLARNSYRRSEVPEYRQQTPEESLAQRRKIIRAADDRSDLERLQDERRSYARQYGGQTRNTIGKLIGIALERTDSERAAKMQEEANRHMTALDEYDKKIQKMEEYERRQKIVDKYSDIPNQKDFADKSKQIDQSNQDDVYRKVNGLSESIASVASNIGTDNVAMWNNRMTKTMDDEKYRQMTDVQRGTYNYLYNTQGADAANEYLSAINKDLQQRATEAAVESQREMVKDGAVGATVANIASVGENLMSAPGFITSAAAKATGHSVDDTYDIFNLSGKMANATRETTAEEIANQDYWEDKNTIFGNTGSWIYNAGMSMADSVAAMLVGKSLGVGLAGGEMNGATLEKVKNITKKATSLIMSSQMATQTVTDMKEKGFSDDRALGVGALYGAVEYISEKLGLDGILGAGGNVFARLAKSFASEGSEEVASNILDRIVDTLANGNQSKMMKAFDKCRAQGLSNSQALAKVVSMAGQEDLSAFLAGGLSGMAMSGANEAIMSGQRHLQQDSYGKNVRSNGNAKKLIDAGLTADENSKLYRIATELADKEKNGKTVSKRQLGKLAMEMQTSDDAETTQAQKTVLEGAVRQRLQDSGVKNVDKAARRFVSSYFDGEGKIKGDKVTKALYAELQDNSTDWAQSTTRSMAYEMLRGGSSAAYMNELLVNPKAKGYNEFKDTYNGIQEAKIEKLNQEAKAQNADVATQAEQTAQQAPVPQDLQRAEPVPESQVKGVLKVQDGHTVVELQDGTKTTTDYVQFDNPNTKAVYKSAAKFGSLGAYALVNNYDSKVNPYSYLHAAESFYNAGASGKITFDQAANTLSAPIEMGIMDRGAANELFLSGQEQSKEIGTTKTAVTKANKNQGGVVTLTGEATITPQEKEVLDRVAAKTKLDIVLDGSLENNDNGYIDPANGKVVLNPDSGHIYATLMHELGEYTHAYNTAEMMDACRPIVEYMLATGDYAHDDKIDLLQKYVDGYSENGKQYSIEDAVSEMIFDFISGEASTQEGGEKFAKWLAEDADLTQKEKKSVVEKIKDFFTKLLDAVRSVIEGQGTLNTTARAGQKAAQQVPVLDDFFNALDNAIDNRQRMLDGDTAQKNSTGEKAGADVRFSIDPEFEKKYDQWDGSDPRVTFFLGTTGRALKKAGMVNQKIYFDASKILKIKNKHPEITDRVIKQIPSVLQNPIVIMKSKDPKNKPRNFKGYTIFGELYVGNNPVLVVLGADMYGRNGMKLDGVKVVSAYRRNNAQSFMDSSDVVFVTKNKERISMWEGRTGLRLPVGDSSTNSPDTTISQTGSSVNTHSMQNGQKNAQNGKNNTRHSLEVDSQGNELTEAQQRRYKHVAPELRDEDGRIKPFYHGTARADRVGYVFDPKRATSGPMAYFTDDPDIATNYSKDKADTSLAYDSDYDSYETQFQVNGKPITEYWNTLTAAEKKAMTEKIKQVTLDDNDNIVLKPGNRYGIGNFDDYELHRAKGNALSVLVDGWLNDGTLWNEESRFLDVLKAVGIDQAQYNDPDYREEKVYQAYLNITNPYNTGKLDQSFIDDLQSYVDNADMSRYATDNAQADMWDKNGIPIEDWLERLQDDLDNGTTHAWTTVPDVVTDFLKDSGYDGIVDQGGKNGGDQHTVAIPFYSNQIKEVTNGNPTDSPDIRYSKRVGFDNALTGAEKKKYNRALQTGEDAGLRISDNSILVECENNSKYQYKYVVYDDMEDGPVIRDVYAIGRIDPNVEDDVASQSHNIARYIRDMEELKYDNTKQHESVLGTCVQDTSYLLARYNNRSKRFHVIGRGSVENGTNTLNKSVRERTAEQDTRAAGELTDSRKSKEITDQYKAAENTGTKYSYAELTAKPDMPITKIDDTVQYVPNAESRKHIVNQAIENAKRVGTTNEDGNAVIHVADIDTDVVVSKKAIKHSLDRRLSVNAPVVQQAGEILSNAVQINELVPRKASIEKANALVGMAKNAQNEPYVVSFIVNKHTKELQSIDVLYAVNAKKEPTGSSKSPQVSTPATGSNISIANLLDYVNRYFPDMLSESVLRQYGYTARPEGEIGKSALYSKSIDDTGRTSLLRDDKRLDEMNITLRQVFDSQELETGHHTSQTQVQRVARQLKKSTGSKMDTPRLMVQLKGLFDYIGNNDDVTFSSVMDQAKEIAHELLDSTPEHTVRDEYAQEVLDTLRGMAITLSDEQKAETAYHHDRYGNYRKRLFGAVNLAKDGQSLDSAWQELAELYPGTFDAEENSQNMPERLLEIVEELKDSYYSYDGMDMDDAATTVAYDIFDAYMDTPEYKTYAQRQNDRFTAMQNKYRKRLQSVKDDYRQRYEEKLKAVQSKSRQDKADMRTQYADQLKAQRQLYAERRHRDVEKRRKTVQKNKIKKQILDLMSLAANGGKERRVPNGLLDSVKELGRAVVLDGKAGERLDSYLNKVRDGFDKMEGNDSQKTEYATLVEDYNNLFKGQILQLKESIGDKSINDMTADELEQTYQLIRSVKKAVTNSNRLFKAEKTATVESQGQQIIRELKGSKKDPNGKKTNERIEFMKGFGYNALKPEYFFRMQGSPTLEKLYHNLRGGQDTWARDCYDARQYSQRLKEKYHAYNWNQKRTFTLDTQYGEKLKFNLQQLLYLYALSRREPAMQHLTHGGMVFDKVSTRSKRGKRIVELTDNTAHPLTVEDIAKATDMLTKEQKAYAQDMQRYLADTMGAKGNEVSRVMYDMDLFTDSDYIPMRSAGDYVQYIQDKANGDAKIKNSGFTNQLNVHANNALVISSFDDVWANHVNDMALYHAFTLPLEDFQRVYNYHTQVGENGTVSQAVRGYMDTESKRYIEQFIRDLNGGVRPDNGSRYVNKGISLFKKGAVFASASVAIQQPSAIARAMAVIPAKHFVATTVSKRDYAQLKKYAPVAIVKEMGYFDTGMGKTATDWINEDKPRGFGKKLRALVTDSDYRDSVLSALPEKADELTWAHIWNACVHEAKTDFHLTGETAYQKAGERFSEVVDRTQVYDSVFSRSGMMRSSDNAMKMATAFMAEPTTSLNMLADAVYQVKNGNAPKSYGTRVVGSLVAAAALNAILQSIVTAARDDDDDKTYLEVYLGQLLPNMWSNLNPSGQIPMLKDVISIFQGYDVSRADMNLFADLYDAVQAMDSDTISTGQKINRLAGALSAFVGLPYKNVARDVQSVFNVIHKATLDMHTGATGTKEVFNDEMKGQLLIDDLLEKFGIEMFPDTDKSAKLYKAVSTGDQETVDRMQREAGDDETFNRMLVAAVKANDQNAGKAAQAHLEGDYDGFDARLQDIIKLGFSDEIAVKAVDGIESAAKALVTAKENDDGTEEYKAEYKEKFDRVVATGFDAKALEKYVSDHVDTSNEPKVNMKSRYDYSDVALAISKNDNSGTKRMRQDLIDTAVKNGYTKDKAEDMVDKAIRREFAKSDERLLRAAEAYKVGAFDTYEANVRAIASDDYFTMDEVATMAKGYTNKTGIPYSSSDVVKAMDTSSGKVKSIISQLEKAGKAGKDGAYIKSRITAAYKDKYIKGDETTRRNIRQKMYNTGLYTADEIYKRTNAWLKSK